MNKSDLIELKYLSEISEGSNIWALTDIVSNSVTSNELKGITGILFFDEGHFGQILEGPRGEVVALWERIKKDVRHQNIELLGITEIKERRFPKWSMKLFNPQEFAEAFPQFSEILNKNQDQSARVMSVMKALCRNI